MNKEVKYTNIGLTTEMYERLMKKLEPGRALYLNKKENAVVISALKYLYQRTDKIIVYGQEKGDS